MKLGTNDIGSVYLGTNAVQKVYLGTNEVWTSFTGLLDTYSGAEAAYSLRKLSGSYSGDAIRVRRASDDTEQDIGFVDGELDTSTLESFCSGTDGFVKTWYDQSGNGNDATNSTASEQPQIVSAGSTITENGKPAVKFDGSDDYFSTSQLLTNNTWSIFTTIKINSMASSWNLLGQHDGTAATGRSQVIANDTSTSKLRTFFNNGSSYNGLYSSSVSNQQYLVESLANNDDYFLTINGSIEEVISNQSLTPLNTNFLIGAIDGPVQPFIGAIQEIVIYTSDQSSNRTGIENNINDFYSIY